MRRYLIPTNAASPEDQQSGMNLLVDYHLAFGAWGKPSRILQAYRGQSTTRDNRTMTGGFVSDFGLIYNGLTRLIPEFGSSYG